MSMRFGTISTATLTTKGGELGSSALNVEATNGKNGEIILTVKPVPVNEKPNRCFKSKAEDRLIEMVQTGTVLLNSLPRDHKPELVANFKESLRLARFALEGR